MDSIYLMLQKNNLRPLPSNEMMNTFDLKGSRFHRKAVKDYAYKQLLNKAYEYEYTVARDLIVDSSNTTTSSAAK